MKCDKCGVELIHDPGRGGWPREREDALAHTPERCRDRLAARLAEAEQTMRGRDTERECNLRNTKELVRADEQIGELRAEARAARYETTLREMRSQCVRGAHSDDDRIIDTIDAALAALAETEKEKP